jgi:hypothetical protein
VKPAGPGWQAWRRRTGIEPAETLLDLVMKLVLSCAVLFGALLGLGGFLLRQPLLGWGALLTVVVGVAGLRQRPRLQALLRGR